MKKDILELQIIIKKLIASQSGSEGQTKRGIKKSLKEKKVAFQVFSNWLQKVAPACGLGKEWNFDVNVQEGSGIVALKDLKDDSLFMCIPRKAMMTVETCWQSPVGKLLKSDPTCQRIPSLALAVFVLFERLNPSSFYQPYLSTLPDPVLPFSFGLDDLAYLSASPSYREILSLKKSTVRQYVHLYSILRKAGHLRLPPFEWVDFEWAVGIVMSRQNRIPSTEGQDTEIALIPGWDSCNHREGKMASYFDPPTNTMQSFTMMDVTKGDPIYLHYGNRPNSQLFLYQGFVYLENKNDFLEFRLPGPANDDLFKIRKLLLLKYKLNDNPPFLLPLVRNKEDGKLWSYLRIVVLTKDEAGVLLKRENKGKADYISERNEAAGRKFLINALNKLLLTYAETIKIDQELLGLSISTSNIALTDQKDSDGAIENEKKIEIKEIKEIPPSKQPKPQRPQKSQNTNEKGLSLNARLCIQLRLAEQLLIQRAVDDTCQYEEECLPKSTKKQDK